MNIRVVENVDAKLLKWEKQLENFMPLWRQISKSIIKLETLWFSTGGLGSWPPLNIETRKVKQGRPPLVKTGRLRASLTTTRVIKEISPGSMTLGTDVDYAHFLQYGTKYMPARPPLVPADRLGLLIKKDLDEFVSYPD